MSYTKQTWATGDTITAEKLNHIEDGIENIGGIVYLHLVLYEEHGAFINQRRLDKTFGEILELLQVGIMPCLLETNEYGYNYYFINSFDYDEYYYISFDNFPFNFIPGHNLNDYPIEDMD